MADGDDAADGRLKALEEAAEDVVDPETGSVPDVNETSDLGLCRCHGGLTEVAPTRDPNETFWRERCGFALRGCLDGLLMRPRSCRTSIEH
ncbi:hypothetical protein [Nocardioides acrostichi]|uniref:Uncharacterized protein n=1 Tax=Nocardioides acrostichi TaxID=2784339 RepID=A0A930V007_9ACTN|nr:hypothetical protein [Nocardioides acrostichi]MBF4160714.1 hypothetical protein [Nocardioides acrostichi]